MGFSCAWEQHGLASAGAQSATGQFPLYLKCLWPPRKSGSARPWLASRCQARGEPYCRVRTALKAAWDAVWVLQKKLSERLSRVDIATISGVSPLASGAGAKMLHSPDTSGARGALQPRKRTPAAAGSDQKSPRAVRETLAKGRWWPIAQQRQQSDCSVP